MIILNPAKTVIDLCGGPLAVSEMTGRTLYRVHRWSWPREKGGTDGMIPQEAMLEMLAKAPERGIKDLTAEHFIYQASKHTRKELNILSMLMDGLSAEAIAKRIKAKPAEIEEVETRLRNSSAISSDTWARVERRRSSSYRPRKQKFE